MFDVPPIPICAQIQKLQIPYDVICSKDRRVLLKDYPDAPMTIWRGGQPKEVTSYVRRVSSGGENAHILKLHELTLRVDIKRSSIRMRFFRQNGQNPFNFIVGEDVSLPEIFPGKDAEPFIQRILDVAPIAAEKFKRSDFGLYFKTRWRNNDSPVLHLDEEDILGMTFDEYATQISTKSACFSINECELLCVDEGKMGILLPGDIVYSKANGLPHRSYFPPVSFEKAVLPKCWAGFMSRSFPLPQQTAETRLRAPATAYRVSEHALL